VHYHFIVIGVFQRTWLSLKICRGILYLVIAIGTFYYCFQRGGDPDTMFLSTESPLFRVYSDIQCNINGSTLLAG